MHVHLVSFEPLAGAIWFRLSGAQHRNIKIGFALNSVAHPVHQAYAKTKKISSSFNVHNKSRECCSTVELFFVVMQLELWALNLEAEPICSPPPHHPPIHRMQILFLHRCVHAADRSSLPPSPGILSLYRRDGFPHHPVPPPGARW